MKQPPTRRDLLAGLGLSAMAGSFPFAMNTLGAAPPADLPRDLAVTQADLGTLYSDVLKIAESNRFALAEGNFATYADYRKAAVDKVLEVLLYRPEKVEPKAEIIERIDREDHIREKVLFSTTPHFRVPGYVLIPKGLKKPAPAIVDLHSHGGMFLFGKEKVVDLGNNHATMTGYHQRNYDGRPTATALVRRGFVVITIDAFMFGERRAMIDADRKYGWDRSKYKAEDVQHLNQVCRSKESTLVKALVLAGATWPGVVFWDDSRTIDYLVTRPEVDAKRIGCVGISMGGYRSIYLSGLDERIKAGCIVGFLSSVKPMLRSHLDTHSWVHFLPTLHRYLDLPDVAGLTSPRHLFVQQCAQDRLFPMEGMKEALVKISQAFEKAGVKDHFVGRFYDVPHQFTRPMQDEAIAWFERVLAS